MRYLTLLSVALALLALSCAGMAITEPLIASTGNATSWEGYEAALATAEAEGYRIIEKDADHSFLRLQSRTLGGPESDSSVNFEIQAWRWEIDINVKVPHDLLLVDSQVQQLNAERKNLAWSIASRARFMAGESRGPRIKSGVR
jgi:hypothetical protein